MVFGSVAGSEYTLADDQPSGGGMTVEGTSRPSIVWSRSLALRFVDGEEVGRERDFLSNQLYTRIIMDSRRREEGYSLRV